MRIFDMVRFIYLLLTAQSAIHYRIFQHPAAMKWWQNHWAQFYEEQAAEKEAKFDEENSRTWYKGQTNLPTPERSLALYQEVDFSDFSKYEFAEQAAAPSFVKQEGDPFSTMLALLCLGTSGFFDLGSASPFSSMLLFAALCFSSNEVGAQPISSSRKYSSFSMSASLPRTITFLLAVGAGVKAAAFDTNDLVAYYPFDGSANDASGNGNNGVVNSATLTTDRFGNANSAYSFDGSTSVISVPGQNLNCPNNMTIAFWMNPSSTQRSSARLFQKYNSIQGAGWIIDQSSTLTNKIRFDYFYPSNPAIGPYTQITSNTWQHVAFVKQENIVKTYIDSILVLKSTAFAQSIIGSSGNEPLLIGVRQFDAMLDDIFIYNRSLSSTEVAFLYNYIPPTIAPTFQPSTQPSTSPTQTPTCFPTPCPTLIPTNVPTILPTNQPTLLPSVMPSNWPSDYPSFNPSKMPTVFPTALPTSAPSMIPTVVPSLMPSGIPSGDPSNRPTYEPTYLPTVVPTDFPTVSPTRFPTIMPSCFPTNAPSMIPTAIPSFIPSASPTNGPTSEPSYEPTFCPTVTPSNFPTVSPSRIPTVFPTALPTSAPSMIPTVVPSLMPSGIPSGDPSNRPTYEPTYLPTVVPTDFPTVSPSELPTIVPSCFPTNDPSVIPTAIPTIMPTGRPTFLPSLVPTNMPTLAPRTIPTVWPTCLPTDDPTRVPTLMPTMVPSCQPTSSPTAMPTRAPTLMPTSIPTNFPTLDPTQLPTSWPSSLPTNHPSFRPTLSPTIMPSGKPSLIATLTPSVMPSGLPTYPPTYWPSDLPSPGPSYSPTWRPSISPSGRPTWMPTYVPTNGPSIIPTTMSSISQMPTQTRRANASITFSFADSRAVNFKRVVYDEKSDTIVVSTDSRLLLIDQATGGIMTGSAIISLADGSEPTIIDMFISDQFLYVMSKVKSTVNPFYFVTTIMRYNIIDGTVSAFGVNGYYFSHSAVILASNTLLSPGNSRADGVCFSRFGIDTFTAMNNPCYFTPGRTYTFAHAIECQLPFLCFGGNTNTGIMVILKVNVNSLDSLTVGAKAYEVQRQDPQSGDTHQLVRLASGAYGDRIITLGQLYRSTEGVSYLCASFQGLTINWAQQMAVSATDVLSVMLPNGDGVVLLCAGYDHFSGAPGRQLVLIKLDENTGEVLSAIKIISLFPVQGDCRFGKIGTRGILITASLLQNDGTQSGLIFFLDLETMTASSLPKDVQFMPFNTTAVLNAKPASLQINVNSLSLGYWTGPRVTSWSMVTTPLAIQQFSKIFSLAAPSFFPTFLPSQLPTRAPSRTPTRLPTRSPAWIQPTRRPVTPAPVLAKNETHMPTLGGAPTSEPSGELSSSSPPTKSPNTRKPSFPPSSAPLTRRPSRAPYVRSGQPSQLPVALSELPTLSPTELLTLLPTLLNTTMKNMTHTEASGEGSGFRAGMIALGAVVMLLVCLLIYWKYRNKKKGSVSPGEKELIDWIQSSIHDIEEGNDGHQIMMDHFLKNLPEAMRHVFSQSEISSFILFIRTIENYVSAFSLNDANKVVPIDEKGLLLFNKETEKSSIDRIYTKGSLASRVLYQCVDNRYQLLQEKLKKEHEKIADDILDEIIANVIATSDRASRRQSVSSEGDNIESLFQKWMEEFVYDDEQEEEERWTEETIVGVVEYSRPEVGKHQEKALGDELTRVLSDNKITLHYHKEIKVGVAVRRASPV